MAAESSFIKSNVQGVLTLSDGTGTPVTLALAYDLGDVEIGPLQEELNEAVKIERRGKFVGLQRGKRVYPTIKFSAWCGNVVGGSSSAPGTPTEFATKKGAYAANISTLGANRKYTCKIALAIEGTNFGDAADETVTCNDVVCSITWKEGSEGNMISIEGEILGTIVSVNSTNTVTYAQVS